MASELPEGVLNARGRFNLPAVKPDIAARLKKLHKRRRPPSRRASWPQVSTPRPAKPQGRRLTPLIGLTMWLVGQPTVDPAPTPPPGHRAGAPWDDLRVGQLVLGADYDKNGEFDG
jgi:hypothetical protein